MRYAGRVLSATLALMAWTCTAAAAQQMTTATVSGSVKDAQGGVLPGVSVVLTNENRGSVVPAVVTNERGEFLVANLVPGTYTMEVALSGFKTVRRTGLTVSGGDRAAVGELALEVSDVSEVVDVTAQKAFIQAESGERSFTVATKSVENLPISTTRSFTTLAALAPGVSGTTNPTRIGGGGPPNIMMDGVSTMDPGANNRPSLQMNVESIAEVKIVSSSYQAEYGRSAGVQVLAVTKSGSNEFRGSVYDVERNSKWNSISKTAKLNGDPKTALRERDWGYSIGGPVGKPGGSNKLFFFYAQEYAPRNNGGATVRLRVPTLLERQGDFSKTTDNNGNLYNFIRNASSGLPCTAANTAGCYQADGVVGRIPASALYAPGQAILNLYPLPNVTTAGSSFNYQAEQPRSKQIATQPAVKLDYQATSALRVSYKYSGWRQKEQAVPGTLPGFNDTIMSHPVVYTWAASGNYTLNKTTFIEATVGRSMLELVGCGPATNGSAPVFCQTAIPVSAAANPANSGLGNLPYLFPDAGVLSPDTHMAWLLDRVSSPVYGNGIVSVLPTFAWGSRIANAPPNVPYPSGGGMNQVISRNVVGSLTKLAGSHTIKIGYCQDHTSKIQTSAAGTGSNAFRGGLSFANNTNNAIDSTFGYANAALGIFDSYRPAELDRRRLQRLLQYRGLRAGHLAPEPVDPRLWRATGASAAAARRVQPDLELPSGALAGIGGAGAVRGRLR